MADKWAVASGNWSSTSTWNDGTLPGSGDDVYADGFTVTVNQDVTVLSLNTTQRSGGTAGGRFQITSGTRTINVQTVNAGGNSCIGTSGSTGAVILNAVTLNGSSVNANTRAVLLETAGASSPSVINCTNILGGGSIGAHGVLSSSASLLTVTCTLCQGGSGSSSGGISMGSASSGGMTFTGNVVGGSGSGATGIGISNGVGAVTINGNVEGGTNATAYGISSSSVNAVTVNGIAIASTIAEAVNNASTGTFNIARFRFASNGKSPWTGNGKIFFSPLSTVNGDVVNSSGTLRTLGRVGG